MFGYLILLFSLSSCFSVSRTNPTGRIIGGHDVDIKNFPYQISLEYQSKHSCGGSIITETYIVTAAHCLVDVTTADLSVRAGSSIRESGGIVRNVSNFYQHPNYDPEAFVTDFDIAVLELSEPLELSEGIRMIDLALEEEILPEGTLVNVTGWGYISESGPRAEILQQVEIPIVNKENCDAKLDVDITETMICAGLSEGGQGSCHSDSGGPLANSNKLYGVVSFSYGCALPDLPAVYANVAALREFLASVIITT